MSDFAMMVQEAGAAAYLVIMLGVGAFCASAAALVLGIVKPSVGRWFAGCALLVVALTLATGLGGRALGLSRVNAAVATVNAPEKELLLHQGYKEAGQNVALALIFSALPFVLAALALGAGWRKPEGRGAFALVGLGFSVALLVASLHVKSQPLPGRPLPEETAGP